MICWRYSSSDPRPTLGPPLVDPLTVLDRLRFQAFSELRAVALRAAFSPEHAVGEVGPILGGSVAALDGLLHQVEALALEFRSALRVLDEEPCRARRLLTDQGSTWPAMPSHDGLEPRGVALVNGPEGLQGELRLFGHGAHVVDRKGLQSLAGLLVGGTTAQQLDAK